MVRFVRSLVEWLRRRKPSDLVLRFRGSTHIMLLP
jgi:hypothetical protein